MNEAILLDTLFGAEPVHDLALRINSDWTQERFELLKQIFNSGSAAWVAKEINKQTGSTFTRNAIVGKAHREGLLRVKEPREWHSLDGRPREKSMSTKPRAKRNKRRVRAPTLFVESEPPLEFIGLTFDELKRGQCRYPRGEGRNMLFCGQPVKEGSSYCRTCYGICYVKPEKRDYDRFGNRRGSSVREHRAR